MNLKKQLFTAFLMVALLPLIIVGIYMFATNTMLALDLHEQNLLNSTEIQADLVEDNINRLIVRARKFSSSRAVRYACQEEVVPDGDIGEELSSEILNFTDETLDNVSIFALMNESGDMVYSSGSNNDSLFLKEDLPHQWDAEEQYISEISFGGKNNSILICTPVQDNGETVGRFLIVCRTDYLLKIISSHRQQESSNALIYCREHQEVITSKQDISGNLSELGQKIGDKKQGTLLCKLDGQQNLVYYRSLTKTPWILVSTIPTKQIFSRVGNYGFINMAALMIDLFIIVFLSQRQSKRMLRPMDQLLDAVEKFFLAGAEHFPQTDIDPKSEIGYLAEKFSGLSYEVAYAQGKLQESNYLYTALLKATYKFRIIINLQTNTIECSSGYLYELLDEIPETNISEKLFIFLTSENEENTSVEALQQIVYGKLTNPIEAETCFHNLKENETKNWYRIVAVPVIQDNNTGQVVLHFEDITKQKQEEFRLIESSQTDTLCGVYNKAAFPLHCKLSENKTDAMYFIDLDKFKLVNDNLGHAAGDNVLVSTAHAIQAQFRENDIVGRFGGDEFVVFAPGINRRMAEQKAKQLLDTISFHLYTPEEMVIHVTASIGICMTFPGITLEQSIQLADKAMYEAKENGRAQFHLIAGAAKTEEHTNEKNN